VPDRFVAARVDTDDGADPVTDRQEQIDGFDQATFSELGVLLIGAGGLGSEIGEGLVRKGVGTLIFCDEDVVEASNLNRQRFFQRDLGANKAEALAANLVAEGTTGTTLLAFPHHFEDVVALGVEFTPDIVVCAPDNDAARLAAAEYFLDTAPVVITGLDQEAVGGYVFVQEPGGACFRCYRPDAGGGEPCPGAAAVKDLTKTVAGTALFAVDSTVLERPRRWDRFEVSLSGLPEPTTRTVAQRDDCSLCGGGP